jgi:hypothetical protein
VYVSGLGPVRLEPGALIRKLKTVLLGAALAGFGYACIGGASRADDVLVILPLFGVGIAAFIAGVVMLWIGWRESV